MLTAIVLATALSGASATPQAAPLEEAIRRYQAVTSYRVTIQSVNSSGREHIVYYFRKPGFVRMEFIEPHAGALLVYSPQTERVRLWPFGYGHFPELTLSPGNPLIRGSGGQHVDHSDVGALFEKVRSLQQHGATEYLGEERLGGRMVLHLVTTGADGFSVAGVHRYELWLDAASEFPAKVVTRDTGNAILETVTMQELQLNQAFPDALFNP